MNTFKTQMTHEQAKRFLKAAYKLVGGVYTENGKCIYSDLAEVSYTSAEPWFENSVWVNVTVIARQTWGDPLDFIPKRWFNKCDWEEEK
jgi:hypothetical protein